MRVYALSLFRAPRFEPCHWKRPNDLMSCFGCTGGDIPSDYVQLPRHKLKALYDKSVLKNDNRLIVSGIFARAGKNSGIYWLTAFRFPPWVCWSYMAYFPNTDKNNTNARIYPKVSVSSMEEWDWCCMDIDSFDARYRYNFTIITCTWLHAAPMYWYLLGGWSIMQSLVYAQHTSALAWLMDWPWCLMLPYLI